MLTKNNINYFLLKKKFNNLKYPFIKYNLLKKFYKKNRRKIYSSIHLYKLSLKIFKFFKKHSTLFLLYNGRKFVKFNFNESKIFLIIGEFVTTRIINSGKILHKRKKK